MRGHGLISEGAPHHDGGCDVCRPDDGRPVLYQAHASRIGWRGVSGDGHGLCACGALSPHLPSANQRKQWHRQHKRKARHDG